MSSTDDTDQEEIDLDDALLDDDLGFVLPLRVERGDNLELAVASVYLVDAGVLVSAEVLVLLP